MQRLIEARLRKEKPELGQPIALDKKKAEPSTADVTPTLLDDKQLKALLGQRRFKSIAELLDDSESHLLESQSFKLLIGLLEVLVQVVVDREKPADLETFEELPDETFGLIASQFVSERAVKGRVSKKLALSSVSLLLRLLLHSE